MVVKNSRLVQQHLLVEAAEAEVFLISRLLRLYFQARKHIPLPHLYLVALGQQQTMERVAQALKATAPHSPSMLSAR